MAKSILTITVADDWRVPKQVAEDLFNRPSDEATFRSALDRYMKGVLKGQLPTGISARLSEQTTAAVTSSQTVTVDQSKLTDGDKLTIGTYDFEWDPTPTGTDEVDMASDDASAASALAAAINARSDINRVFSATSSGGVVTIKYYGDGMSGRLIPLTKTEVTSAAMTLSNASFLASGSGGSGVAAVEWTRGV